MSNLSLVSTAAQSAQGLCNISAANTNSTCRIARVALQALSFLENNLSRPLTRENSLFPLEYFTLSPQEKLSSLKIIEAGIRKHELLRQIGAQTTKIERYYRAIAQEIQSVSPLKTNSSPIRFLTELIETIRKENSKKDLSLPSTEIANLKQIQSEWYGLHITPESLVDLHKNNPDTTIGSILYSLVSLRQLISEQRFCRINPLEHQAKENYKACLNKLVEYLATQVTNLSVDEIRDLQAEIPEVLELVEIVLKNPSEDSDDKNSQSRYDEFVQFKSDLLYYPFSPSEKELDKNIAWIKNHKRALTTYLSSGYQISPIRFNEISQSFDYYAQCERKLELAQADLIVRRNFGSKLF